MSLRFPEPEEGPPIATDRDASDDNFEVVKVAFGAPGSPAEVVRVEHSAPLPSRDYHGGTERFDSGLEPVDAGAPVLVGPGVDTFLDAILLVNATGQVQPFQLTDGNDLAYSGRALDAKELRVIPMYGFKFADGVKLGATNAAAVFVQLKGTR